MARLQGFVVAWLIAARLAVGEEVKITKEADGVFVVAAGNYSARVGPDGNLNSLASGGTEFLLDGYRGLVGGGYITITEGPEWKAEVFKFTTVEQAGHDTLAAIAENHKLTYQFLPDAIELAFSHTSPPTIWYFTLNPAVRDMLEKKSGETLPPKTVWREGVTQAFNARGANVTFPSGALYYIAKNANKKPDSDPQVLQVWMSRTWGNSTTTQRVVIHSKPRAADALQATLEVSPGNHLFPGGKPAEITIGAKMRFPGLTVDGQMELAVADALTKREVSRQTQPLKLAAQGETKVTFPMTPPAGFYEAALRVKQGDEILATRRFPLVYDIERMPAPERPADFDDFWDQTLAEQEKAPANVQWTLAKEEPTHKLYKLRFDGLLGRQFHAWLSAPMKEGKYLAHLILPPSGIHTPYLPASGPGIVGMSLAIAGQEVEPPAGGYPPWDYWRGGIENRETWYYRSVFAACSRAVDILAARPEVDGTKIFVTGGSQGGGLAFITAALNPKVTMAVCGSPGLFGLEWKLRHLGPNFWPPIDILDDKGKFVTEPAAIDARCAVIRYGDAAHFAPRIRSAVLLNVGLQDPVTSPVGVLASWSRLSKAKVRAVLADPWAGHNGPRGGQHLGSLWQQGLAEGQRGRGIEIREAGGLPVLVESDE